MGISAYEASVYRNVRERLGFCNVCTKIASCSFCPRQITYDEQRVYKRTKHKLYMAEYDYRITADGKWTHNGQPVTQQEIDEYTHMGHKAYFEKYFAEDLLNGSGEVRYA